MGAAEFSTRRKTCYGILIVLSIFLIVSGSLTPLMMDNVYRVIIDTMMVLDESSLIFAEWAHPVLPMFLSYYIVDIQNPEEFKNGAKPIVKDKGPYVYRVHMDRVNLTFHDNGTLSYQTRYNYFFEPDQSVGNESDRIITPNLTLMSIVYSIRNETNETQILMNNLLNAIGEELTLNLTVGELMWGYTKPPLTPFDRYRETGEFVIQDDEDDDDNERMRPGILSTVNGTVMYEFNIFDGVADQKLINTIDNYWGEPTLDWWWTEEANAIIGTDGTMYHPYVTRKEDLYMFNAEFCRSVPYIYEKDVEFKGVPLLRFKMAPYAWANATDWPPNEGFCSGKPDMCNHASGYMRQDPCRSDSPIGISNPHFYEGDHSLIDAVEGMNPIKELHENLMDIEPLMGMPYVFKLRLQITMDTTQNDFIDEVKNIREFTLPIVWFQQSVEVEDYVIDDYNTGFVTTAKFGLAMQWMSICTGILIFILVFCDTLRRRSIELKSDDISDDEKAEMKEYDHPTNGGKASLNTSNMSNDQTKDAYANPMFNSL